MNKYKIDSHKLLYHVDRVSKWKNGEMVYPIYMEVSPAGSCNHRCTYCALDFMEYQRRYLETNPFKERLTEMGQLGLKSIMYAGEGEPFRHKDMVDIINHTKASGIDVALTTNAVLMSPNITDAILANTEWIKVSINGATDETYAKIHQTKKGDFKMVVDNMAYANELRKKKNYKCALGMQLLLLPENHQETIALAKLAKEIGMDYLVIKPYSQHPQSKTELYKDIKYSDYYYLADELKELNDKSFQSVFRIQSMLEWDNSQRSYKRCIALPFWSYIDSGGSVWGCSVYLGDERFLYGNINEQSFQEIWEGEMRAKSLKWVESELDASQCRINCRMDKINSYLQEIKEPPEHANFI